MNVYLLAECGSAGDDSDGNGDDNDNKIIVLIIMMIPQQFYGPFSGTTRVSRCQNRTSGLYGASED